MSGFRLTSTSLFDTKLLKKNYTVAKEWKCRVLNDVYPIVFFSDLIRHEARVEGELVFMAIYVAMAINI